MGRLDGFVARISGDLSVVVHTAMIQAGTRAFLHDVCRRVVRSSSNGWTTCEASDGRIDLSALLTCWVCRSMTGALICIVPKFEPLRANAKNPCRQK
jgi:hypothetical protein